LVEWQTNEKGADTVSGNRDWHGNIVKQLNELKSTITDKDYKKFKLNLLLCVAQRVAEFSTGCGQCMLHQQDVATVSRDLGNIIQLNDKEGRKAYHKTINKIIGHLQKQHKLVTEGYYMGIFMAIGTGFGVAIGAVTDNVGSGIPIGVGVGVAIGVALDAKAKKEGRILCPRETTGSSKTALVLGIIVGLLLLSALVGFFLYRRFS
jgi:hypothetical protein